MATPAAAALFAAALPRTPESSEASTSTNHPNPRGNQRGRGSRGSSMGWQRGGRGMRGDEEMSGNGEGREGFRRKGKEGRKSNGPMGERVSIRSTRLASTTHPQHRSIRHVASSNHSIDSKTAQLDTPSPEQRYDAEIRTDECDDRIYSPLAICAPEFPSRRRILLRFCATTTVAREATSTQPHHLPHQPSRPSVSSSSHVIRRQTKCSISRIWLGMRC